MGPCASFASVLTTLHTPEYSRATTLALTAACVMAPPPNASIARLRNKGATKPARSQRLGLARQAALEMSILLFQLSQNASCKKNRLQRLKTYLTHEAQGQ